MNCLLGIVDKIAQLKLTETAKMDNNQLKSRAIAWLSVLNELAVWYAIITVVFAFLLHFLLLSFTTLNCYIGKHRIY